MPPHEFLTSDLLEAFLSLFDIQSVRCQGKKENPEKKIFFNLKLTNQTKPTTHLRMKKQGKG